MNFIAYSFDPIYNANDSGQTVLCNMYSLLFEILSEEIPATMLSKATSDLQALLEQELESAYVKVIGGEYYNSPRRLACYCQLVAQESVSEVRGPKVQADERAIVGFLSKYKIADRSQLQLRDGHYIYSQTNSAVIVNAALIGLALERVITKFPWPKTMRWGVNTVKWVRPIHSILCLLNDEVLPIRYGHLTASNTTFGHRFMENTGHSLEVHHAHDYAELLYEAHVIANPVKRRSTILKQIDQLVHPLGLRLREDEKLLDEVCNLVEWPVVMLGIIPERLMALPPEVLIISLRGHQRYLLLQSPDGSLSSNFLIVANISPKDGGKKIIEGNQRVLQARLVDAMFFYDQDCEVSLLDRAEELRKVQYHAEIGSVYDKMETTKQMAELLAPLFDVELELLQKAVPLLKADLLSNMVKEFPELQGVMGCYYARHQGVDPQIADAICEHYRPRGASDEVPVQPLSRLLSLAEKLDNIRQLFSIGIKPTGSKDPFAIRRCAIGSLRIVQAQGLEIQEVLSGLGLSAEVRDFILSRSAV